jgi:hypothetical protein
MGRFLTLFFLIVCVGGFTGCSGSRETAELELLMLPMEYGPVDPSDAQARGAIRAFLEQTAAPVASTYDITRFDLNGDGRREALVLFKTPYGFWCNINGCTMLILEAHDTEFSLVNDVQPIRTPLYVGNTQTNGWKDLIIHVSGRWDPTKDVALKYNGRQYPRNPDSLPAYLRYAASNSPPLFY